MIPYDSALLQAPPNLLLTFALRIPKFPKLHSSFQLLQGWAGRTKPAFKTDKLQHNLLAHWIDQPTLKASVLLQEEVPPSIRYFLYSTDLASVLPPATDGLSPFLLEPKRQQSQWLARPTSRPLQRTKLLAICPNCFFSFVLYRLAIPPHSGVQYLHYLKSAKFE